MIIVGLLAKENSSSSSSQKLLSDKESVSVGSYGNDWNIDPLTAICFIMSAIILTCFIRNSCGFIIL